MTLGLCMIVKNESEVLARALDSVESCVDEIVIVDTGSTDGTKEIARKYTDKVYDFEWIDDFAAARNFALEKTESDYFIWLDADDVVPPATAKRISRLMRTADGLTDIYMLPYVLTVNERGKPVFSYYRERIIKNNEKYKWRGCVHEAIALGGTVAKLSCGILHAKPTSRSAGTRNLDIYRAMLKRGVRLEPRERYYYARELFYNGLTFDAIREFEAFLTSSNGFNANLIDACIMLSRCYRQTGDADSALAAAFHSFAYGLPTGEGCCEIGSIYFDRGDYANAAYWYDTARRAKPDLGSGAFVDGDCYKFLPYVWLTVCYDRMGKRDKAYAMHKKAQRLRPDHPTIIANQAYFSGLGYK